MSDPVRLLDKEARALVRRLRLWTPARWAAAADPWGTRADLGRHLAQAFADTAAALEGRPTRPLPRLDPDLLVADQLAVTADDLVRADPDEQACQDALAHLLLHRTELLDDEVPQSLGGPGILRAGRAVCCS